LLLGGLIQEQTNESQSGLPFVSRVPFLRNLFGSSSNHRDRTELIVLITPRVISSVDEGRQATQEYVRQFQSLTPLRTSAQPSASAAPPRPVQTYPVQEPAKPQEEQPRDR